MNIYLVTEGSCDKKIYKSWLCIQYPHLKVVDYIDEVVNNHVYIIAGNGTKDFKTIQDGVADVYKLTQFDRLVIAFDSEKLSFQEKYTEINQIIINEGKNIDYKIIIQHFCIETWALGNKNIVPRLPISDEIIKYLTVYDVGILDPEGLPCYPINNPEKRARFAYRYLKALLHEKYNLSYNKKRPFSICNDEYLSEIRKRFENVDHLKSFEGFLTAFSN